MFLPLKQGIIKKISKYDEIKSLEGVIAVEFQYSVGDFMQFSDILYLLNPTIRFHWQWRVIMRALHDSGTQDQNQAIAFIVDSEKDRLKTHQLLTSLKKRVRQDMGETPVIVKSSGAIEIALGIHHVHVSEFERVHVEYNTLMHALNKTSVFAGT